MCEPTLILTGITLAGTIAADRAAGKAADRQSEALTDAAIANVQALTTQDLQEQAATQQTIFEAKKASLEAEGAAISKAAEFGQSGLSQVRLVGDVKSEFSDLISDAQINLQTRRSAIQARKEEVAAGAKASASALTKPTALGTGLKVAAIGAKHQQSVKDITPNQQSLT